MEVQVTVAILTGLLFYVVAGQPLPCSPWFKMYDGTSEVTNSNCTLYKTNYCKNGTSSFPANLSVGMSTGKPRDFTASVSRVNVTAGSAVLRVSHVTFTWKPPLERISREHTKGYYLKLKQVGGTLVICRLFDLQQFNLTRSSQFHFSYEMNPLTLRSGQTSYQVELYSLPPPNDLEYQQGLVEQYVISLQTYQNFSEERVIYPNKWGTWMRVNRYKAEGILEVLFGFPDKDSLAEFTQFDLKLVRKGDTVSFKQQLIRRLDSETVGKCNFTEVPSGEYQVKLLPRDLYPRDVNHCQCYRENSNLANRDCASCTFVWTEFFNFTSHWTTTSSPSTAYGSTNVPSITTTNTTTAAAPTTTSPGIPISSQGPNTTEAVETPGSAGIIAAAVIVPVILLVAVIVLLFILYKRGKLSAMCGGCTNENENNNVEKKPKPSSGPFIHIIDITGVGKELMVPELNRKKVLLLASEDHKYFTQTVEKFAQFLKVHCLCDVTYAPQQLPQLRETGNSYCWLSRQIDSADFVIIITSEAALRLYLAFRKGNGYTKAELGPEGDLFTPGIQHICGKIANNEDVRNIMMVYFDHTSPSFRLPIAPLPSFHYHLPSHLPTFLHHIHGLDKNRMDLSQVNLPLLGNVEELKEGEEWLAAVQETANYEKLNCTWFDQKFGKPTELYPTRHTKPDYSKQDSDDSGFTESRNSRELKRRLSSASNHAEEGIDGLEFDVENSGFICTKHDFFAPSMLTTNTAYTIPYPDHDKPSEIDDKSLSEEFHRLNMQYEQDLLQFQEHEVAPEERSAYSDHTHSSHTDQVLSHHQMDGGYVIVPRLDDDHDCISVTSAQSV